VANTTTLFPSIEGQDDKIAQLLDAAVRMCGRADATLVGIAEAYYRILCAEFHGEITPARRQIMVQKILNGVPNGMKDIVDCVFRRIEMLPRRLTHA